MAAIRKIALWCIAILCLSITGCRDSDEKEKGALVTEKTDIVTLDQINKAPATYEDVFIELRGHFSNMCCAGCFTYKEGIESIEVVTDVRGWENFKPGTPVTIKGHLRVTEKRTADGSTDTMIHIDAKEVLKR